MIFDRMLYLVITDHQSELFSGPIIYEVEPANMDRETVRRDIRDGQYGAVLHVIELCPAGLICREVTDEFREDIARSSRE